MEQTPFSPVSNHFRFNDLPSDIRHQIYKILLCTVEDTLQDIEDNGCTFIPVRITRLQHDIHPQILRTCRKINKEATIFMRETNLFVMVTGLIRLDEPRNCLFSKSVPMIKIKNEEFKYVRKGCVMTHEIYDCPGNPRVIPDDPYRFMLHHRHLPQLCEALVGSTIGTLPYYDETSAPHIVTILNPYDEDTSEPSFLSQELQELLIAPYRSYFNGFSGFRLEGNIPTELKDGVMSEITWQPQLNHEATIHGLQSMEAKGDEYLARGDLENANQIWCRALMSIRRVLTVSKRQTSHAVDDLDFFHQLLNIYFDLSSKRLQYLINIMQTAGTQRRKVLFRVFLRIVDDPENIQCQCNLMAWKPSQYELAGFRYREAVGARVAGHSRASAAIRCALHLMPNNPQFLEEQKTIDRLFEALGGLIQQKYRDGPDFYL